MKHLIVLIALPLAGLHAAEGDKPKIKLTGFGPPEMVAKSVQQPGETRADGAVPSHPNAMRLSRDVWMVLFGTRMFTGTDDDRSIYCQLRRGQVNGPLIRERVLTLEGKSWEPLKERKDIRKVTGTPTGFGVPKDAITNGRPAPNANVFMAVWYTYPKLRIGGRNADAKSANDRVGTSNLKLMDELIGQFHLECVQFRLNDAEDDIEILQAVRELKQIGFEDARFASAHAMHVNHSMTPPKPTDASCEKWMELSQFGNSYAEYRLAAMLYQFNHDKRLYEWVRTGPLSPVIPGGGLAPCESSLNKIGDDWIICARGSGRGSPTIWYRVKDPLDTWTEAIIRDEPKDSSQKVACICADGVFRIFANHRAASPYDEWRNPLYCWDVNLKDFTVSNRRLVFDAHAAGLPLKNPFIDCAKLLPAGGGKQYVGMRILTPLKWHKLPNYPTVLTQEEFAFLGAHFIEMKYDGPVPDEWDFGPGTASKPAAR